MSNPSPVCTVGGAATAGGVNVTAGASIVIKLANAAGAKFWVPTCISTDDGQTAAAVQATAAFNGVDTWTFTAPASPCALRFQSQVGAAYGLGLDANGQPLPGYTDANNVVVPGATTFGVYVPTAAGLRLMALNETTEGNASFGWVSNINANAKAAGGGNVSISATTVGATSTAAITAIAQADQTTVRYTATVEARDSSSGNSYSVQVVSVWKRAGTTMTQVGSTLYVGEVDEIGLAPSARPNFAASGTGVVLNVTGLGGVTIGFGGSVATSAFTLNATAPSPTTYSGAKVTGFTAANYLSAPATSFPGIGSGKTLVYLFSWDAPGSGAGQFPALHIAGTAPAGNTATAGDKGFILLYSTSAGSLQAYFLNGATPTTQNLGQPVVGLNMLVLWNDGANLKYLLTAVSAGLVTAGTVNSVAAPTYVAPDGGSIQQIGTWGYPSNPNWYFGGLLAFAALSRVPTSSAEALGWTQAVCPTAAANRFVLPTSITSDPSCTVDWNASRDWDGVAATSVSHGSAPITWTINGSPTRTLLTEEYITALGTYMVDTGTATAAGNHLNTDPLARLSFTSPVGQQQVAFAFVSTDSQVSTYNYTEMGAVIDGTFAAQVPANPATGYADSAVHLLWVAASSTPTATQTSHAFQLYTGAQIEEPSGGTIVGGYIAGIQCNGSQAFNTTPPNKRLVLVGDSTTVGYYVIPPQQGLTALIRADYPTSGGPGGVTAYAAGGRRLYDQTTGGSNVTPFATNIVTRAQVVAGGGTKTVYISTGVNDYLIPIAGWSATSFGTAYGSTMDSIHTQDSAIAIFGQQMIQAHWYAIANSNGDNLAAFNTAIANQATGRAWFNNVNVSTWTDITFSDFTHPDAPGYAAWKAHIKTTLGY